MLRGVSPLLSPDLLACLARMGHGDEIVLADAHFPGHSVHDSVIRLDGVRIPPLLDGLLPVFEIDSYGSEAVVMMDAEPGDTLDPAVEHGYQERIDAHFRDAPRVSKLSRQAFYDRSRTAYAVVMTGDTATYANLILRKGVVPITD